MPVAAQDASRSDRAHAGPILRVDQAELQVAGSVLLRIPALQVARGQVVVIRGRSGAGKSSLLRALVGAPALRWSAGRVELGGRSIDETGTDRAAVDWPTLRREVVTWVPQDPRTTFDPTRVLRSQLLERSGKGETEVVDAAAPLFGSDRERVRSLLEELPQIPSGGELRRLALSLAWSREAPLVLLDEPGVGLDPASLMELCRQISSLAASRQRAVLVTTHQVELVEGLQTLGALEVFEIHGGVLGPARPRAPGWGVDGDSATGEPRLVLQDFTVVLPDGQRLGQELSLTIHAGEIVGLRAPSGVGKTSLLRGLTGRLRVEGSCDPGDLRVRMASQDAVASLPGWRTPGSVLSEAGAAKRDVSDLLAELRLPAEFASRRIDTLSGGEARRIAVARALASKPELLVLDEPFADLDGESRSAMAHALLERARAGLPILIATHDVDVAEGFCHRWLSLQSCT